MRIIVPMFSLDTFRVTFWLHYYQSSGTQPPKGSWCQRENTCCFCISKLSLYIGKDVQKYLVYVFYFLLGVVQWTNIFQQGVPNQDQPGYLAKAWETKFIQCIYSLFSVSPAVRRCCIMLIVQKCILSSYQAILHVIHNTFPTSPPVFTAFTASVNTMLGLPLQGDL